jgi:hypothetical protein
MKDILERIATALEKSNEITEKYFEKILAPVLKSSADYRHINVPLPVDSAGIRKFLEIRELTNDEVMKEGILVAAKELSKCNED